MRARKFIVAGVTATTLLGGGVAAFAAGGHSPSRDANHPGSAAGDAAPSASGTPTAKPSGEPQGGGPHGGGPHGGGPQGGGPHGGRGHDLPKGSPGFQHAESVSGSAAKGFTTTDTQHGIVTAYRAGSSVTVLSADAFSKTYVITTATKTDSGHTSSKTGIAVGDTVDISATLASGTDTARHISDHGTPVAATASPSVSPTA